MLNAGTSPRPSVGSSSAQVQGGKDVLAGLENFPLTYMAMPGYCGWPNGPKSPVAQFDLTYLAIEMTLQQEPLDMNGV